MSPTRREFLLAVGTGTAGALLLPGMAGAATPVVDQHLCVDAFIGKLLPPTTRPQPLICPECNRVLAVALVDELDNPEKVVCDDCHREQINALEDQVSDNHEDASWDLEDAEERAEKYKELHQRMERAFDSVTTQYFKLRDIRAQLYLDDARWHGIQMDRLRESLDDLQRLFNETI